MKGFKEVVDLLVLERPHHLAEQIVTTHDGLKVRIIV
jgi:hypothetical protein